MEYLQRELAEISYAFTGVTEGRAVPVMYVEPQKPREGMVVYADGTEWDPGSGAGQYLYNGSAWLPAFSLWTQGVGEISYAGNVAIGGNLDFSGTDRRITGNMSDATFSNRLALQSNVTNGQTLPFLLPNGTATGSGWILANTSDADNAGYLALICNNSIATIQAARTGTGTAVPLTFATGSGATEAMRIDTSQRVIIGATAALSGDKVSVVSATYNPSQSVQLTLLDSTALATGVGGMIGFGGKYTGSTYTTWSGIQGGKENATDNNYSGYLGFYTRANGNVWAERMRLDSTGVLTITKTSSGALTSPLILKNSATAASTQVALDFMPHTSVVTGRIGNAYISGTQYDLIFSTYDGGGLSEYMRLGGGILSIPKGQIKFPATQNASSDANTLDDYEEGTFTATLKGLTTDPTTPVTTTAYYTKIGRKVFFTIAFGNVTTTGASGQLQVAGLPFGASAAAAQVTGDVMIYLAATFVGTPSGYITGTTITFYYNASNSAWGNVTHNAGTGRYVWVSGQYFV
jgi:hypothetical protein